METLETLKGIVISKFTELQDYTKAYNQKAGTDRTKIMESREILESDPDKFDVDTIGRDILFINGYHQVDIRRLQENALTAYKLYRELGGDAEFDKELMDTMGILQASLPKQLFVLENGKFVEIEEGRVDTLKQEYKSKGYFKFFEEQVRKLVANE